jgi:HNH endonuclease
MSRIRPNLLPSVDELRRIFEYDPETGLVTWRVDRFNRLRRCVAKAGETAGAFHHGYRLISLGRREDRAYFHAHRIAWKLFYGEEPPGQIDHIDRDRGNNAIANLRAASQLGNAANRSLAKDNKSGCTGVGWYERCQKWRAYIKSTHLGYFAEYQDAVAAREKAATEVFGAFSPHLR